MAKITIPTEAGNCAIQDGTLRKLIQQAAISWHPEAVYFTTFEGQRTAFMVFDMTDTSDMLPFAAPFFERLGALVELAPVMNTDDLQKGWSRL
jgi:hypothetical protein